MQSYKICSGNELSEMCTCPHIVTIPDKTTIIENSIPLTPIQSLSSCPVDIPCREMTTIITQSSHSVQPTALGLLDFTVVSFDAIVAYDYLTALQSISHDINSSNFPRLPFKANQLQIFVADYGFPVLHFGEQ